ncbi:hypothetical protein ESCO_001020 [Escovopsis weberi]|uniref:Uncharacterized protein n=1 Tax=Escovopsis weberi TaxID=150374 RepID=A0A0N0RTG3_ESCWE|nr:hypothetical protein ESCO_001020 [Escovopsis weberi]
MSSSPRSETLESDLAESVNDFLKDMSHQGHRVAQVQTQAKTMPEPPVHYRGEIEVSDPGSSRARRVRFRSPSDGNETDSSASLDDETMSHDSSSTASSMAESVRAERRRMITPFWEQPAPPALAQTAASSLIPCEFHWRLLGDCEARFRPTDIDGLIQHVVSQHLECKLPRKAACWFCDEVVFQAQSEEFDAEMYNFGTRTRHIAQHFSGGKTVWDIRPDHYFLDHLIRHGLINQADFELATKYHEAPQPRGGIKTERSSKRSDWGENIESSHRYHRRRH